MHHASLRPSYSSNYFFELNDLAVEAIGPLGTTCFFKISYLFSNGKKFSCSVANARVCVAGFSCILHNVLHIPNVLCDDSSAGFGAVSLSSPFKCQ